MNINRNTIDLNAPAFGPGSQTPESMNAEPQTIVEEPAEELIENEPVNEDLEEPVGENSVPYSRFKKFHDKALAAEQEAERLRAHLEELETSRIAPASGDQDMPAEWVELYGNSEASQRAWQLQQRQWQEMENRAYERALQAAEEYEVRQKQQIEQNVSAIDDQFDSLSDYVGRDLTAKEQSAILDIVDDLTPKDANGNYAGPLISFEKAWEFYELKQNTATSSKRRERDSVAALAGAGSQGSPSGSAEADQNWNPLARGTWRSRL